MHRGEIFQSQNIWHWGVVNSINYPTTDEQHSTQATDETTPEAQVSCFTFDAGTAREYTQNRTIRNKGQSGFMLL